VVAKAATPALTALQLAAGKQSMKASRAAESAQRDMLAAVRRTGSRVRRSLCSLSRCRRGQGVTVAAVREEEMRLRGDTGINAGVLRAQYLPPR
jgi:hypothetical protein